MIDALLDFGNFLWSLFIVFLFVMGLISKRARKAYFDLVSIAIDEAHIHYYRHKKVEYPLAYKAYRAETRTCRCGAIKRKYIV